MLPKGRSTQMALALRGVFGTKVRNSPDRSVYAAGFRFSVNVMR